MPAPADCLQYNGNAGTNPYSTLQTSVSTPDFPGVGRNSFRGPSYQDIDLTVMKEFGLPAMKVIGEAARIQLGMTAFSVFNKLNLAPFTLGEQLDDSQLLQQRSRCSSRATALHGTLTCRSSTNTISDTL